MDGPAFSVVPGDPDSPVILALPHTSRHIPAWARARLLINDEVLAEEIDLLTDTGIDRVALAAADRAGRRPWLVINEVSPLVVDPVRFPDEREPLAGFGMGQVYTMTTTGRPLRDTLDLDHREDLLACFYRPYTAALTGLVAERIDAAGWAVLLDLRSYPVWALACEPDPHAARPRVCLGTEPFHTTPDLVAAAADCFAVLGETATDTPSPGAYVPLAYWRQHRLVRSLRIDLRRDACPSDPAPDDPAVTGLAEMVDWIDGQTPPPLWTGTVAADDE